ncbi:ATP-binding protein [Nocardia uniformis]|uniref:ATP-binding protein n=1 Tax=Nocardia uniformis TaxID=53432 RepID=A0A849BZP8_9NOCA|nr:ATP-binding protein [Nocardia uniformis]NNH72023.1 ATP-binding protein [Nocardia uniformis]
MSVGTGIRWERNVRQGCSVVSPHGELNARTYRQLSDDLVKFAMDEPRAVIVVLDDLRVDGEPLLTAFSSARMRVGEWPGVPIILVVESANRRQWLESSAIRRFVPVFDSVSAAVHTVDAPLRRRARFDIGRAGDCAQRARRFVADTCDRWGATDIRGDALLVVTELVENAFLHARDDSDIRLRVEWRDDLLTIAVADSDPREAVLREPGPGSARHYGLHVVARLVRAWGCAPQIHGGKVVWARLDSRSPRKRPPPS